MRGPASLSSPYVQPLLQLLKDISKGHIQIPRFQRQFLWTDDKRLELLRSIRDGIPMGSILLWRTNLEALGSASAIGPHELPRPEPSHATQRTYLLDGVQRLSTLYGSLWPLSKGRSPFLEDEEGELQSWLVCYDLESEDFVIAESEQTPASWLPLTSIFDSVMLLQFQRRLAGHAEAEVLSRRADVLAETFRGYMLPVIPINTDSLADATRTFERINSQGTRMSELHMVRALAWSDGFDLDEALERAASELESVGWQSLDPELILQAAKAALWLDVSVEAPDKLREGLKRSPETLARVTQSLASLAGWLRRLGILSPRLVPYPAQVVMLAEAFRWAGDFPPVILQRLERWLWQTTYAGYFASISGHRMNALLESVRAVAQGSRVTWPGGEAPVPRFDLPQRFDARAARLKAAALRLAGREPLDESGKSLGALDLLAAQGPRVMVHIIPPSAGVAGVHGIANRTFMPPASDLAHRLYADPGSLKQEVLDSHLITPGAAEALERRDYGLFLQLRKAAMERLEREFFESLPEG